MRESLLDVIVAQVYRNAILFNRPVVSAMRKEDATYWTHRAHTEIALARSAGTPEAASAHWRMAEAYFRRLSRMPKRAMAAR